MSIKNKGHLSQVGESYFKHGLFALREGFAIIIIGLASIIHGFFPFLLPFYAPRELLKKARLAKDKHPELYKEIIEP